MATDRNTLASLGGGDVFGSSSVLYAALDGGDVIIGPRSKNKSEMHARVINVRVSTEDTGASAQKHPRSGSTCEEVEDRGSEQHAARSTYETDTAASFAQLAQNQCCVHVVIASSKK